MKILQFQIISRRKNYTHRLSISKIYPRDIIEILESFFRAECLRRRMKKKVTCIVLLGLRFTCRYKVNINRQDKQIDRYSEETIDALRTATDRTDYYLSCIGRLVQLRQVAHASHRKERRILMGTSRDPHADNPRDLS